MPTKEQAPLIRVTPPGPKARQVLARDKRYLSPSYTRVYPLVVRRGSGMVIEDEDGNRYLDFNAGVAVAITGHCHPQVVEAICRQTRELIHMAGPDFYYHQMSDLAKKLTEITPGRWPKKAFLCNTGAEAVETAMKLARYYTRRPRFIAFMGGFHGRTMGALSLTASKPVQRRHFAPMLSEVTHIPYPYCYRCTFNLTYPKCNFACLAYLKDVIFNKVAPPEDVAAIIIEPMQGEGGYVMAPNGYFQRLRKICDEFGILLVADEIQSGMGRTGKMFAIEHWRIIPDIICIAKGLASGLPIGAIVSRASLQIWPYGSHANTFGGNPVTCAAALKTIQLIQNGLMDNATRTGNYLIRELHGLKKKYECIGDIRGKGLMVGVEIVKDRQTKTKAPIWRNKIVDWCFKHGILIMASGDSSLRFSPPLIVTNHQIDTALDIFEQAVRKYC